MNFVFGYFLIGIAMATTIELYKKLRNWKGRHVSDEVSVIIALVLGWPFGIGAQVFMSTQKLIARSQGRTYWNTSNGQWGHPQGRVKSFRTICGQ